MPPSVSNDTITRSDLPPPGPVTASNMPAPAPAPAPASSLPPGSYAWTPDGVKPMGDGNTAPASYTPPSPQGGARSGAHVVAAGETLYGIARQYGVHPAELASANGFDTNTQVRIGQRRL